MSMDPKQFRTGPDSLPPCRSAYHYMSYPKKKLDRLEAAFDDPLDHSHACLWLYMTQEV